MDDFDFINDGFFAAWKNRTKKAQQKNEQAGGPTSEAADIGLNFDASDIEVKLELSLEDVLFPINGADALSREISYR